MKDHCYILQIREDFIRDDEIHQPVSKKNDRLDLKNSYFISWRRFFRCFVKKRRNNKNVNLKKERKEKGGVKLVRVDSSVFQM